MNIYGGVMYAYLTLYGFETSTILIVWSYVYTYNYIIQNALKFNFRRVNFQIFLGGMPPDPLELACFACRCAPYIYAHKFTSVYVDSQAILVAVPVEKSFLWA